MERAAAIVARSITSFRNADKTATAPLILRDFVNG
jgi:hypothetical protein